MATVPQQAIYDWHTVKPSSYAAFCLMCEVKDSRSEDVYLDQEKAEEAGIKHSAYYQALNELETKDWIRFSRKANGKKRWKLVKGFEVIENKEVSINAENSANTEKRGENLSVNVEFSANVENQEAENSTNVEIPLEPPIRNNPPKEEFYEREINAGAGFEPFDETERLLDEDFRRGVDETLFWIQSQKRLSRRNFPAQEWLTVIESLSLEGIHCVDGEGGFKDFYLWVEGLDWVETVSPNLLQSQIEKYKKRDQLKTKKKNGTIQNNSNGHRKPTPAETFESYGYYDNPGS